MKWNVQNAKLSAVAGIRSQILRTSVPQIAFSGRSNVGKSSLINVLLGRKGLARTGAMPGKTITINYYGIDGKLYFVDLPGYGYAKRSPSEKERISSLGNDYFNIGRPRGVLQLIDMRVGPTADDEMMIEYLEEHEIPYAVIATKCDKLNKTERAAFCEKYGFDPDTVIPFSALTGEGKEDVWDVISVLCER